MSRKSKGPTKPSKLSNEDLCTIAKQRTGVKDARIISPSEVQTAPWVRLRCQFGCDGYRQCLVCPPFTPTPEQMRKVLDAYARAILIYFNSQVDVKATSSGRFSCAGRGKPLAWVLGHVTSARNAP